MWDNAVGLLVFIAYIAFFVLGIAQLVLGYIGIEDWLGSVWASGALVLAAVLRIMLPLTVGTFLAMTNVYGFDWWVGAIVAAPGLLLIAPAMVTAVISEALNKVRN